MHRLHAVLGGGHGDPRIQTACEGLGGRYHGGRCGEAGSRHAAVAGGGQVGGDAILLD